MKKIIIGLSLILSLPSFATEALRDGEGKPLPEHSFYATYEVLYDQEWLVDKSGKKTKPRELVVFNDFLEMLTVHPRALLKSDPDRYVQVLGRYLKPDQFHQAMVGGKLGKILQQQFEEDFRFLFLASLTPDMYPPDDYKLDPQTVLRVANAIQATSTHLPDDQCHLTKEGRQAFQELHQALDGMLSLKPYTMQEEIFLSFGEEVISKFSAYHTLTMGSPDVQEALKCGGLKNYQVWYALLRTLPWIAREKTEAHFHLSMPESQKLVNEMSINEFLMTVRYYERKFNFKPPQQASQLVATYFHTNIRNPVEFMRLQGQVILMFEAAYNPFAPHYTLGQVHDIFRMIFRDFLNDNRSDGGDICNELQNGRFSELQAGFEKLVGENQQNGIMEVCEVADGIPVAAITPTQGLRSNLYGYHSVLNQAKHETLKHMWQAYLIIRQDDKNDQGYHKLQGTLDTASLIVPRLQVLIEHYEKALAP